jgi:hypothetical protein
MTVGSQNLPQAALIFPAFKSTWQAVLNMHIFVPFWERRVTVCEVLKLCFALSI